MKEMVAAADKDRSDNAATWLKIEYEKWPGDKGEIQPFMRYFN